MPGSRKTSREEAFAAGPSGWSLTPSMTSTPSNTPYLWNYSGQVSPPPDGVDANNLPQGALNTSHSTALSATLLRSLCSPTLKLFVSNHEEPSLKRWYGEPSGKQTHSSSSSWASQYYSNPAECPQLQESFPAPYLLTGKPLRVVTPRGTPGMKRVRQESNCSCVLQFNDFSGYSPIITGHNLWALGKSLGWPNTSSPNFFAVCYACFHHNAKDGDHTTLHQAAWERVFSSFEDDLTLDCAAHQLWAQIEASFSDPRGGIFAMFHRFLFDFLLLRNQEVNNPNGSAVTTKLPMEIRPRRLGVFCKKLTRLSVTLALLITLDRVTPWVRLIVNYLNESCVRVVRQDEWRSLFPFVHKVQFPTCDGYNEDDGWPCMLDDFVAWFRHRQTELPVDDD